MEVDEGLRAEEIRMSCKVVGAQKSDRKPNILSQ
jgi:hypothetical protein